MAILCPGQGAQHPQMLKLLVGNRAAEDVFEQGARALGTDVRSWLAQQDCIETNAIAQPLLCLSEMAMWAALRGSLPEPLVFAGYSVGELASYGCAGALDAGQLARLAQTRAKLMDEASAMPGGLIAIRGLRRDVVQELCAGQAAWIAIAEADDAFVVGGRAIALDMIAIQGEAHGAKITALRIGVASHTPLLVTAVPAFREVLDGSALSAPRVTVAAGIDGSLVTSRLRAIAMLAAQLSSPIEWSRCIVDVRTWRSDVS